MLGSQHTSFCRHIIRKIAPFAATAMLLAGNAFGAAGDLDPSFGTGGRVTTSLGSLNNGTYGIFYAVAVQPDGKILAVGDGFVDGLRESYVFRYNADGSIDTSFGSAGKAAIPSMILPANAMVLQPDGKIVVGGGQFSLTRYNADGTPDTGFVLDGSAPGIVNALVLQPDGKIIAAGEVASDAGRTIAVARYNSNGSSDITFAGGGIVTASPGSAFGAARQTDGKVVLVGFNGFDTVVARYNGDGTPDASFGDAGTIVVNVGSQTVSAATSVGIQPDGKIVIAGHIADFGVPQAFFTDVMRFNINGVLDPGFGVGGIVKTAVGDSGQAYALALQADGKIVVAGQMPSPAGNMDAFVARYNSDGSTDDGFGTAGVVLTNFASGFDTAHAVALQADGRIVTAGAAYDPGTQVQSYMLSRYVADSSSVGNTPVGTNVRVSLGNGTTAIFSTVSVAGNTTVATGASGEAPPAGFNLGAPATYYDVQTTAVHAGPITVCIAYDPAAYGPPATLRLFHYEGAWVDVTTTNDTTNFVICGQTTTLSPFAIFSTKPSTLVRYLLTKIKSLHLRHGLTHSLREKLQDVLRAIDSRRGIDTKKACREMRAFIREVQAKSGKKITPTTATMLLAEANMIKVALGCQ